MTLREAFKQKRDHEIENLMEQWKKSTLEEDPLLRSWKIYMEKRENTCLKKRRQK